MPTVYRFIRFCILSWPFYQPVFPVFSQSGTLPVPELITSREGLPQAFVPAIVQDRQGFIWLATRDGLCRYDGRSFKVFQPDPGGHASLSSSAMADLVTDHKGNLWIMSETGDLDQFDPKTEKFENVSKRPSYARFPGRQKLHRFLIDKRDRLWGILMDGKIFYYDLKTNISNQLGDHSTTQKIASDEIGMSLAEDQNGNIWIATESGIQKFDEPRGTFLQFALSPQKEEKYEIGGLLIRGDGGILISSSKNLYVLNPATGNVQSYPLPVRGDEWWKTSIVQDQKGVIYFDQDDVLFRFTEKEGLTLAAKWKHNGEESASMFIDRSEVLWIGTDGAGIRKYDLRGTPFEASKYEVNFTMDLLTKWLGVPAAEIPVSVAKSISYFFRSAFDRQDNMWFNGGSWPIYKLNLKTGKISAIPDKAILSAKTSNNFGYNNNAEPPIPLAADPDGTIWAYHYNTAYQYDGLKMRWVKFPYPISDKPVLNVMQFVVDDSALWFATELEGLLKVDKKTGQKTRYVNRADNPSSLSSNSLFCLFADRFDPEKLWIGTFGSGLCLFNKKTGRCKRINADDGLPNNVIYSAIPDHSGNIWIGTNQGLSRLDARTLKTQNYTSEDGLIANEFNRLHFLQLPAGRIILGGIEGITAFDPANLKTDNYQPVIEITDIEINNVKKKPGIGGILNGAASQSFQRLDLTYDQNFLKIQFAALQFNKPGKNRFRYRLEGLNDNWVYTERPDAIYTGLKPGTYRLDLNATNTSGLWSKNVRTLDIVIRPPFWATWWAYLIYFLLAVALIIYLASRYKQRVRLQQAVALRKQEAEQLRTLDQMKTKFFSNITHEFRTPLTLILSPARQLLTEAEDPVKHQRLSIIEKNAEKLLLLINQLMELSKLEANAMKLSLQRGFLSEIFQNWIKPFENQAEQKKIEIRFVSELNAEYWFDAGKTETIVNNLLSNALKFSPAEGIITITLAEETISSQPGIIITVSDTGIGIPSDQLPFIFDRFYQADSSWIAVKNQEGTGIGLSLVKELVLLMGGWITAYSTEQQGSVFKTWLPFKKIGEGMEKVDFKQPEPQSDILRSLANESPSVLIVEDNDDLADYITESLPAHYQIERSENGEAGYKKAIEQMPDLIISDVMMPLMNGYELCQKLKADFHTSHIPVIMLTAKSSVESRLEGLSLGADDYLTKPFHVKELQLRVQNLLESRQRLRERVKNELNEPGNFSDIAQPEHTDPFILHIYSILEKKLDNSAFGNDELVAEIGMSRMSIYRKVKNLTGLSTGDLIRLYRLKRATELLKSGRKIAETAYMVGFETPSHFAKVFREQYSITPSQFVDQD
ncbi:hybrid sensor histidine kinase/response regulator transcription factor [Dyadobacter arcticus]|uniref:histidine kinase n=1 Tax=Dyadobacter arcticus TaxID=1078754 RepID=A0ABX0UID5_9BACT|nr:ATP-binding protein [Dyadobacter arcticus]NIJ52771.1 signal transduction histidine kinase/ligand-binding sensor domain-containing protein/CheY-like chemotaxis protein [Dyadobacter arcticus]